jgi:hypothetical protein
LNDPKALDQLKKLLAQAVPEAGVEDASSIDGALSAIAKTLQSGYVYDLAILDFKLPPSAGHTEEVDTSICRQLTGRMQNIVICHISACMNDPDVQKHILAGHSADRIRGFDLGKLEPDFATELVRNVRQSLCGPRLRREIEDVMSRISGRRATPEMLRFGAPARQPSLTTRLMSLPIDIGRYWEFLNSDTQGYIQGQTSVR